MNNKKLFVRFIIILVTLMLLSLIFSILNKKKINNSVPMRGTAGITTEASLTKDRKNITLEEAQELIKMDCIGSDVGKECQWNNIKYSFLKPENWEQDKEKRIQACQEGFINEAYNIVTDGSTWYITTNFEEDNANLVKALSTVGLECEVKSYCR